MPAKPVSTTPTPVAPAASSGTSGAAQPGVARKESLELGRIGAPYGVKGWVHVQSFTSPPERLLKYREWNLESARVTTALKVLEGRPQGAGIVARLEGIEDRDQAARMQGAVIHVPRSAMPKLRKREFYQADLIGLAASNAEGVALGTVAHFVETPAGSVMVIRQENRREHWVPATREHLLKVDLDAGHVQVSWPAEWDESDASEPDTADADQDSTDEKE